MVGEEASEWEFLNDPYNWQTRVTIVSKHFLFRSGSMAHKVFAATKQLQRNLGSCFLQINLLDNLTEDVDDDENNYLPSEDIFLGLVTCNLLRKKAEDGDLSVGQHDKFIKATIAFYRESLWYTLLKIMLTPVSGTAMDWFQFLPEGQMVSRWVFCGEIQRYSPIWWLRNG